MTRATLVYPVQLRDHMAQLVLPRDLQEDEAKRLCALIRSLVTPAESGNDPKRR